MAAGLFAAILTGTVYKFEDLFQHLPIHWMWWPTLGGLAVGIGGYFQPRALGVGYDVIGDFLSGHMGLAAILALVLVKGFIWSLSLGSGTSGGVLAPLLIMGSGLGALEASFLPADASSLWPLVSMAALLGGVMRSPFTAILFAFELTHDEGALLPLLIATMVAHTFTVLVMKRSILTEKVARRGFHIFREYSVDILERVHVEDVMSREVVGIPAGIGTRELMSKYFNGTQKHRGYPVLDEGGRLLGILTVSDLLIRPIRKGARAGDLIRREPVVALPGETCRQAAGRMAAHGIGRLIVVETLEPRKVIGILSRSDLFKPSLKYLEEEDIRESYIFRSVKETAGRKPAASGMKVTPAPVGEIP